MPGPLPNPQRRRRNAPTVPTTDLPASGRKGRPPNPPAAYELRTAGLAWWRWAWGLPQAAAWDRGSLYTIARRAQLEDDLAAMELNDHLGLDDLLAGAEPEAIKRVEWALETLKRAAAGKLAVEKEMRELDGRLGLNPEALAKLRWTIVVDAAVQAGLEEADKQRCSAARQIEIAAQANAGAPGARRTDVIGPGVS